MLQHHLAAAQYMMRGQRRCSRHSLCCAAPCCTVLCYALACPAQVVWDMPANALPEVPPGVQCRIVTLDQVCARACVCKF
jgi:hypothetical protein